MKRDELIAFINSEDNDYREVNPDFGDENIVYLEPTSPTIAKYIKRDKAMLGDAAEYVQYKHTDYNERVMTEPADDIDEWADKVETLFDDEDDESIYYTIGLAIDLSKADDADDIEYELDQLYSEGEQGFEDERENVLL